MFDLLDLLLLCIENVGATLILWSYLNAQYGRATVPVINKDLTATFCAVCVFRVRVGHERIVTTSNRTGV